jgi:hypothetical protein
MGKSKELFRKYKEMEKNLDDYGDDYVDYVDIPKQSEEKDSTCEED